MVTMLFKNTHIIHVTCSWHAADAMLTRVTLTPDARDIDARVAAPPSVPHLAADLTLRASARHPSVRLLNAFMATRSSASFFHSLLRALRLSIGQQTPVSAAQ